MLTVLEGDASDNANRETLNDRYRALLETEIKASTTNTIRAQIRLELAQRDARTSQREQRLRKIAEGLAALESDAETPEFRKRVSDVLRATGYVAVDGKVLPRDEAFPPFGYTR